MMPEEITLTEASARTGYNTSTLRYAIRRGDLPGTKYGKTWKVNPDDLQQWIDNPEVHKSGRRKSSDQ